MSSHLALHGYCGCVRTGANTENMWGCNQYMPRLYSHPRKYKKTLGELFIYWFLASGMWNKKIATIWSGSLKMLI